MWKTFSKESYSEAGDVKIVCQYKKEFLIRSGFLNFLMTKKANESNDIPAEIYII